MTHFSLPTIILVTSEVFSRACEAFLGVYIATLTKIVKWMGTRQKRNPSPPVPCRVQIPASGIGTVNLERSKRPGFTAYAPGRLCAVKNDPSRPVQGCTWPRHRLFQTLHRSWPVEKEALLGVKCGPTWTICPPGPPDCRARPFGLATGVLQTRQ